MVKKNPFWLICALVLMLISGIGAGAVQTSGGSVEVKDLRWETPDGHLMSALLFKPRDVGADNKAPGIVVSHGWWNNREMQDMNFTELARRGYVVLSIDMYAHGNSDPIPSSDFLANGTGMYAAVRLLADLPYVNADQIGVSGHSNGARAANLSVLVDNAAQKPLIKSVLLVDNDPLYVNPETKAYENVYGTRDVGVIAAQYDEFFFRSYSPEGEMLTPPREYPTTPNAQSFLHGGADPAQITDQRDPGVIYTDGPGKRAIYSLPQTHPWSTISAAAGEHLIDFFEASLPAPHPLDGSDQIWQWKAIFNLIGLVGFAIFVVALARALVGTRLFAGLRREPLEVAPMTRSQACWFWGGLGVATLVSGLSYVWLANSQAMAAIAFNIIDFPFKQGAVFFIAAWAAINGLVGVLIMVVTWLAAGRRQGRTLRDLGAWPGWRGLGLAVAAGVVVTSAAFACVFVTTYFFGTDFRAWVLAVKTFTPDKVWIGLMYLPLFAIYFIANSVSVNAFSRFTLGGKEWLNTALLAFFNALAPLILVVWQYLHFWRTGYTLTWFGGIYSIWLFPVLVLLPAAAIVSRKLYRVTNNPYYGGFIMAAIVTLISVSNTLTVV